MFLAPCLADCKKPVAESLPQCFEICKVLPKGNLQILPNKPEIGGPGPLLPLFSSGAEPVFQLLPQAVVNADGFLQVLAQVPDSTKMLL